MEKIQELADYLARPLSEEERTTFIKPFVTALLPDESKKPFEEDAGRRKAVLDLVVERVNGVGEGTDKGTFSVWDGSMAENDWRLWLMLALQRSRGFSISWWHTYLMRMRIQVLR